MTNIGRSNELKAYCASEWNAGVGYLAREFEVQQEIERSNSMNRPGGTGKISNGSKNHFLGWIFGRRNSPR
jgi:hypothetical protein